MLLWMVSSSESVRVGVLRKRLWIGPALSVGDLGMMCQWVWGTSWPAAVPLLMATVVAGASVAVSIAGVT